MREVEARCIQEKVDGWYESVRTLAGVARKHCSPAYADCECLRATPENVRTDSYHPSTFSCIHLASTYLSPISQAPVFVSRRNQQVTTSGAPAMVASSDTIVFTTLFQLNAALPSRMQAAWSASKYVTWPLSVDIRCPVMAQDACQLSGAVRIGSGRSSPACFTGREVIDLTGDPSPTPLIALGVDLSRRVTMSSVTGSWIWRARLSPPLTYATIPSYTRFAP